MQSYPEASLIGGQRGLVSTETRCMSAPELFELAQATRLRALEMIYSAKMGHVGGDFSCLDILTVLYQDVLNVDPARPDWPERDRFVLSKGHASGALYATLAMRGFFPADRLATYMAPLSKLNGHPNRNATAGVEANTGPLGHGLPIALGMALGAKNAGAAWRVFVLTGDGEMQEGSNWEAAMTAAHNRLDNLTLIIDRNRLQQGDETENTSKLNPLDEKLKAFGWEVISLDGHDHAELSARLRALPLATGRPNCIIANTVKGKGVSFMENNVAWHHKVPNEKEYKSARRELGARPE